MSTGNTSSPGSPRRGRTKKDKKSLWQMDMGSLGKNKKTGDGDDVVEHEPFVPTLPHVNLLPKSISDSFAIARIRRYLIASLVLLMVVVGGAWWLQGSTIAEAEADLAAATTENARLRGDLEALAPVKQLYEQITRLRDVVDTTLASQPQSSLVLSRLEEAGAAVAGRPILFTGADVIYTGIPAPGDDLNSCPNPDPFGSEITVGCLTFTAEAADRDQVSDLLRMLDDDPLFVGPYVTSTTATTSAAGANAQRQETVVSFSGSVGVSLAALQTQLTPEQVEAIINPPKKEAAPTASPSAEAS